MEKEIEDGWGRREERGRENFLKGLMGAEDNFTYIWGIYSTPRATCRPKTLVLDRKLKTILLTCEESTPHPGSSHRTPF
jgi:hypothetical protein